MSPLAVIRALGPIDLRSVSRDSMLLWLVIVTPAMGLLFRFTIPAVTTWLDRRLEFDLVPYYPLCMSFVAIVVCGIVGTIIGFLLLDQRDDQTLPALLVTPMSIGDYVRYRLFVPTLVAVVMTAIMFPLAGFTRLTVVQVVVTSVCAAPIAAMYALFIASVASNKVQGFAVAKAIGVLFVPTIISYFVPMPWQVLFGVVPLYWPLKVFWLFDAGSNAVWAFAAVGLAYHAFLLWLLAGWFARVVRR